MPQREAEQQRVRRRDGEAAHELRQLAEAPRGVPEDEQDAEHDRARSRARSASPRRIDRDGMRASRTPSAASARTSMRRSGQASVGASASATGKRSASGNQQERGEPHRHLPDRRRDPGRRAPARRASATPGRGSSVASSAISSRMLLTDARRAGSTPVSRKLRPNSRLEEGDDLEHRQRVDEPRVDQAIVVADAARAACSGRLNRSRGTRRARPGPPRVPSRVIVPLAHPQTSFLNATLRRAIPTGTEAPCSNL